jgi:hypothetical protein
VPAKLGERQGPSWQRSERESAHVARLFGQRYPELAALAETQVAGLAAEQARRRRVAQHMRTLLSRTRGSR